MTSIKPLGDRVLVRPCEVEEVSPGGVLLPHSSIDDEQTTTGIVVNVGPGSWQSVGETMMRVVLDVAPNDKVLFRPYGGTEVMVDGVKHRLLQFNEVLAVLGDE